MEENNKEKNAIEVIEEKKEEKDENFEKQKRIRFIVLFLIGFIFVLKGVPFIINGIASLLGFKVHKAITILIMALCFYLLGELFLRIKNKYDVDV